MIFTIATTVIMVMEVMVITVTITMVTMILKAIIVMMMRMITTITLLITNSITLFLNHTVSFHTPANQLQTERTREQQDGPYPSHGIIIVLPRGVEEKAHV